MIQRPRAVLLDWGNTLVDSWPVIHEALICALDAIGEEIPKVPAELRFFDCASHLRRIRDL